MTQATRQHELHQVQDSWSPYAHLSAGVRARLRTLWNWTGCNHDTASKVRYEFDMLLLRGRCAASARFRHHLRDLTTRRHLRVHLGCGNALFEDWVNLDCYPPTPRSGREILTLDMRRGLPFAAGSVAALFSEHFLEHLPFTTVRTRIIPEIRRVLEPGGHVRLAVPSGEYFIEQYLACMRGEADPLFERNRHDMTPMTMLNEIAHGYGHYFLYDFQTLQKVLVESGFIDVRRVHAHQSEVECFKDLDRNDEWRVAMSLYVEARAPVVATAPA